MIKSKQYRVFEKAEEIIVKETNRRIKETRRPQKRQEVANDMIEQYPELVKKIHELQK